MKQDFSILAKGVAFGLLGDMTADAHNLVKGLEEGAANVRKAKVGNFDQATGCDSLPAQDKQIEDLKAAVHRHFSAYEVTPEALSSDDQFPDKVALAFCDQIGDDGSSDCNDIMARSISAALESHAQSFASHQSDQEDSHTGEEKEHQGGEEESHNSAKVTLKYTPVKYLKCDAPDTPDLGPNPNEGPFVGFGQHLEVAMEMSCTSLILKCAYVNKDFGIPAKAIAFGLLGDMKRKADSLEKGLKDGTARINKAKIGDINDKTGCDTLPSREKQIEDLTAAVHKHFSAYGVSSTSLIKFEDFLEYLSGSVCNQIGDDGKTSICSDMLQRGISQHFKP